MNRTTCHFEKLVGMEANVRVLLSGREFGKLLLSNAGQALLAAILLLADVRSN
ncbi:MAG: hypothetical protein IPQ04_11655 [Saprospiraceae bacterium]|nr:hypothetical protein [Saprospiraceae bacterium]